MRPRFLKNIGRVSLAVVRHAEDAPTTVREAIEERRDRNREALKERAATLRARDAGSTDL